MQAVPHGQRRTQRLHAEWHVLEVCQSETPAVFTRVTLPTNETKRFDK